MKLLATCLAGTAIAASAAAVLAQSDPVQLIAGCTWRDQIVEISGKPDLRLSFRWQDCDGKNAARVKFALDAENTLVQSWDGANDPVAQFWAIDGRSVPELIETVASPSVTEPERGRCRVRLDYVTHHYSYEPIATYMEELLARDEPFAACGALGETNDGIQYFAVIDKRVLAFFWVGQDTPLFDPDSFKILE